MIVTVTVTGGAPGGGDLRRGRGSGHGRRMFENAFEARA
jgi:hypothetical protein